MIKKSPPLQMSYHAVLIVAALLFAAFLASHSMSRDFLWWDEHWSTQIAGTGSYSPLSLMAVWQNASADPWHPPAFYLILNLWNSIFGGSQFALRLFPFFTGMLALAWVYRFGAWAGGRVVGLGALCFLCGSAFFLDFMTELRPYMLYALFGIMCPALYWRFITGKPNKMVPWLFGFSVLGLLYSHYFAALVAVALGSYHLLFVRKNRLWWQTIGYAVGGAVLFVPWLFVFLTAVQIASGGERYNVLENGEALFLLIRGLGNAEANISFMPFMVIFIRGIVVTVRHQTGRFILWSFAIILIWALAINAWLAVLAHLRYVIVLWGFAAVLVGWAFHWALQQQKEYGRLFIVVVLIYWWGLAANHMLFSLDFQNRMFRQDFVNIFRPNLPLYDALKTIEPELHNDDILLLDSPIGDWAVAGAFSYYTGSWGIPRSMLTQLPDDSETEFAQTLRDYTAQANRVWFAYETHLPDFHRAAFETLAAKELTFCGTAFTSPDLRLDEYSRYPSCCQPTNANIAEYTGIGLDHVEMLQQTTEAVSFVLSWAVHNTVPANTYSYGLYLLDAENQVLAQADTGLPTYDFSCQTVTLNLANVPPGEYAVYLTIYNWQTLARLSGQANGQTGEVLPVTHVIIE